MVSERCVIFNLPNITRNLLPKQNTVLLDNEDLVHKDRSILRRLNDPTVHLNPLPNNQFTPLPCITYVQHILQIKPRKEKKGENDI